MIDVDICDYIRTPIGRFGGSLPAVRADDLAAVPSKVLMGRNVDVDWEVVDEVIFGCANQAGEDHSDVARMAALLAGLPVSVSGVTINRLCGSGMDAVSAAGHAIKADEAELMIAGGIESMSRAPFVVPKAETAFPRRAEIHETTIGWRFVNPLMKAQHRVNSVLETSENVAEDFSVSRENQDSFALRPQAKAAAAAAAAEKFRRLVKEITPVTIPQLKRDLIVVDCDEHPRETTLEALARLLTPSRKGGSVTAGNASCVNGGAAALIVPREAAARQYGLIPLARILGGAAAGVAPCIMGMAPVPATQKLCVRLGIAPPDFDVVELSEASASQGIAVLSAHGIAEDAEHVKRNGGAIALGHPLGKSGAHITSTAALELALGGGKRSLSTMCVGVGQCIAIVLERV